MGTSGCPSCGARVSARVGGGLCPTCLLGLALVEPEETADAPRGGDLAEAAIVAVLDGSPGRIVYLAERRATRQWLSVEVVSAVAAGATTPGTFGARVEELRRLSHPAIACVLGGWVTVDGAYCVASEYLPSVALERYCGARRVPTAERAALFLVVSRGLAYAHAAGVLHGRLGTGSPVMTRRGAQMHPVLTGFGPLVGTGLTAATDVAAMGEILDRVLGDEQGPVAGAARAVAHAARTGGIASASALVTALERVLGDDRA